DGGGDGGDGSWSSSGDEDEKDDDEPDETPLVLNDEPPSSESECSSSSGSSSDDDDDGEEDSDGGPPALESSSNTDSDKGAGASCGSTLYSEYVLAREGHPGPTASMAFWRDKKHSTSAVFTDFFVQKVVRGRPIPHVGTALFLKDFPSGFPEFVSCVGQMKPAKFKETSGPDVPHGFYEYARDAASRNAKMMMAKRSQRKSMPRSGPAVSGKRTT
ncbi:unnamed protein product, partial [Ectocarpus sp. 12 AP-2014]